MALIAAFVLLLLSTNIRVIPKVQGEILEERTSWNLKKNLDERNDEEEYDPEEEGEILDGDDGDETGGILFPTNTSVTESGGVPFNSLSGSNDLEGPLQGSVFFAQVAIIPSKPPTDKKDIRPHLVSTRDTLVLFKPLDTKIGAGDGVKLSVLDGNDASIFDGEMLTPDKLPRNIESVDGYGTEFLFLEQESYGYEISTQSELNEIESNNEHLEKIFSENNLTKIELKDDHWIETFNLPKIEKDDGIVSMVLFISNAETSSYIKYEGKTIKLKGGDKLAFINLNGVWDNIYEVSYKENKSIREFIANNKKYGWEITSKMGKVINKLDDPEDTDVLNTFLKKKGNVKFSLDSRYKRSIYLPTNTIKNDGKVITITQKRKSDITVIYDFGSTKVSANKTLIFVNNAGKWVEWSDALYSAIHYGDGFWSLKIPKDFVKPGIHISFTSNGVNGILKNVKVGAPSELLLHTIDIGMLIPPKNEFTFQTDLDCQAELFQRIPVYRIIVNQYEPIHLTEIVLPNNITYTDTSYDEGDTHNGDMRNLIAKGLISAGINSANYGIHSSPGPSKKPNEYYYTVAQFTVHMARGAYANGIVPHGMSGGGTIVTLAKTCKRGKGEMSHELGHNWVGHYPNGFAGSVHRPAEYFGSTWGWDSGKNVFVPNFKKFPNGKNACFCKKNKKTGEKKCLACQAPFFGHEFGKDAMAGGGQPTRRFTLHTPYSLWQIQQGHKGLETKVVFDKNSNTGMRKWNPDCSCMQPWSPTVDEDDVDEPRTPVEQGVPVATLLGFYDPELRFRTYIYPALHGAYGNIFKENSEEEIQKIGAKGCHAVITNSKEETKKFALKGERQEAEKTKFHGLNMNKFHINVAEAFDPISITINCRGKKIADRSISKPTKPLSVTINGKVVATTKISKM